MFAAVVASLAAAMAPAQMLQKLDNASAGLPQSRIPLRETLSKLISKSLKTKGNCAEHENLLQEKDFLAFLETSLLDEQAQCQMPSWTMDVMVHWDGCWEE